MTGLPRQYRFLMAALPLSFLAVFYFYPLAKIFLVSFTSTGLWDTGGLHKLFTTGIYARTLWFTFWQAALSTLLTLVAALPGAYVFARYRFPGKSLLKALTTIPFVLPTVVVAVAFRALLGPRGLINTWWIQAGFDEPLIQIDQTVIFILLAHVFYNYTLVVRIVGGFWSRLDPAMVEAARMLGASHRQSFFKITLPLLMPAVTAAALLIFTFCFTSFGVILILGGPRNATLEVEIYRQAMHLFNLPLAAALSLIQIVFTFILMYVYTWLGRRTAVSLHPVSSSQTLSGPRTKSEKILVLGNVLFMLLLLGLPLAAPVIRSLTSTDGFSLVFYRALLNNASGDVFFVRPGQAIFNSLAFAATAMMLSLVLGLAASVFLCGPSSRVTGFLDPLFMLPLSTSAVTLGFGFILALNKPPLDLRTSPALVPIAHALVAFPFVVRSILPALRSLPENLRESAAILGASPWRVWRHVDLPIIGRALLVGAVFAFAVSMGEFGATTFVARPQSPTMPLAIFRFLGQPGAMNYGQALAMSTLLMIITGGGFLFLERFRVGPAEF